MRNFLEIPNLRWGRQVHEPNAANSGSDGESSIFELLPRAQWTLLAKMHWYLNLRYWKQAVAALTIYSGTLISWAYLVR
jgi:hypothetical protein